MLVDIPESPRQKLPEWRRRPILTSSILPLAVILSCGPKCLLALEAELELAGQRVRVLAPEIVQQGERAHVLLISRPIEAGTAELAVPSDLRLILQIELPPGVFDTEGAARSEASVDWEPSRIDPTRRAVSDLVARRDIDVGEFEARLELIVWRAGEHVPVARESLTWSLRTVAGARVRAGLPSILVPVIFSIIALPICLWILRRHGERGAWRTSQPVECSAPEDAWWSQKRQS